MSDYAYAAQLPLDDSWDVIVVGGGPAGCAAAIAAARDNAKTLLLEANTFLGGMGTGGLVSQWASFSDQTQIIYKGIAETVLNLSSAEMLGITDKNRYRPPIDPEKLKRVYDQLVTDSGVKIQFATQLSAVQTDNRNVDALIVSNKAGLTALKAKVYIDCTGDGDLAAFSGASFDKGDAKGEMQAGSLCFIISGVNDYNYIYGKPLNPAAKDSPMPAVIESGEYPLLDSHLGNVIIGSTTVSFNAGHVAVDGTDPDSVTQALINGRKTALQIHEALEKHVPATFSGSFLATTAYNLGVRETRRIIGDYIFTADDYQNRASFSDEICRNCYYIDVHVSVPGQLKRPAASRYEPGESHGIPYRCLCPKDLDNVLVAGRCISTDRLAQGSIRVMPTCLATGEAAGAAAVLAMSCNNNVHQVDTDILRDILRKHGAYLP